MATVHKFILANDQIYHTCNRGVDRREMFTDRREYSRAIATIKYYQHKQVPIKYSKFLIQNQEIQANMLAAINHPDNLLVEIISYCLMPNRYHFLLKQFVDDGIRTFLSNFTNSYTKYFNTKHERVGPLVQGPFQAVRMETNEQAMHVSRYIHINPTTSFLIKPEQLSNYAWSSFREYLGLESGLCSPQIILDQFSSIQSYKDFVYDQISYAQELHKIKHLTLE